MVRTERDWNRPRVIGLVMEVITRVMVLEEDSAVVVTEETDIM